MQTKRKPKWKFIENILFTSRKLDGELSNGKKPKFFDMAPDLLAVDTASFSATNTLTITSRGIIRNHFLHS